MGRNNTQRGFFVLAHSIAHTHPLVLPRLLVYACCLHVGVSPGEDTDSEWGLAPKKNSSEDCGLAEKDLVLEVSSEDWVEGEWSQLGLAR